MLSCMLRQAEQELGGQHQRMETWFDFQERLAGCSKDGDMV